MIGSAETCSPFVPGLYRNVMCVFLDRCHPSGTLYGHQQLLGVAVWALRPLGLTQDALGLNMFAFSAFPVLGVVRESPPLSNLVQTCWCQLYIPGTSVDSTFSMAYQLPPLYFIVAVLILFWRFAFIFISIGLALPSYWHPISLFHPLLITICTFPW